jgi:hypothetical protein
MLQLTYLTVLLLAGYATDRAVRGREGQASDVLYNAFAALAFGVLALASVNIEVVTSSGSVVATEQYYLGVLWFILGVANALFVGVEAINLLDADGNYLPGVGGSR